MTIMGNSMGAWEAHVAIKQKNVSLLSQQLNLGKLNANIRFRRDTLLATAIHENQIEIIGLLLENGADPNLKSYENGRNETPIITATRLNNLQAVQVLVKHGADIHSSNFYGHDAIFRAVFENSFPILEYLLLHTSTENGSHEFRKICPLILAIKDAPVYPLKKRCLLLLLKYNYNCSCLSPDCSIFSEIYECEFYYKIYETDPDILRWIYLAKGLRVYYMHRMHSENNISSVVFPLKLVNLSRIVLRNAISESASGSKGNFTQNVLKLPLPKKLIDFLLMGDLLG